MRRTHIVLIIVLVILIFLAAIVSTSRQATSLEQVAALFLGFLGGLAALSEIIGLLDRLGIPETIKPSEPKFVSKPKKPFETSVALWGPRYSGKSWLINAFAWNIQQKYGGNTSGLQYKLIRKLESSFPLDLTRRPEATSERTLISFRFERSKTSNDYYQSISSFSHEIHLYDFPGESSVQMFDDDKSSRFGMPDLLMDIDADIVIIVLDPTRITDSHLSIFGFETKYSQHEYAEMVRKLLRIFEKADPTKQRLYAVCITKVDIIPNGIYLHPDALIEMFFGSEMSDALKIPPKENVQTFTTSSCGFLPSTTQANFDEVSQYLKNKDSWQPYGVEFPFFWAFEFQEKALLRNTLRKGIFGNLTLRRVLNHYVQYPKPKYET